MTEYRSQHYIPKFYLKNFSGDKKGLYRYSLENRTSKRSSLSKACTARDFYGKGQTGAEFEKAMSALESVHAEIIQKIIKERSLANITQEEFLYLCNFALLMRTRHKASKKQIELIANLVFDWMKPSLVKSEKAKELGLTLEEFQKFKLARSTANVEAMRVAINGAPLIADLAATLLINKTKRPFFTSDSPAIFANYMSVDRWTNMVGYLSRGLIIFLPLSEGITLCLFDPAINTLTGSTKGNVNVTRKQDINALNRLQMLIADEYVFFSKSDYYDYVLLLHDQELANHRANYSSVVSNLPSKTPLETPDLNHKKTRRRHYFSFFAVNAPAIKHFQNMAADPRDRKSVV